VITVAPAQPAQAKAIAEIAEEMDRFYGATKMEPQETRIMQIGEALFSDPPSAYSLLAWDDGKLVGFAAYSFLCKYSEMAWLPEVSSQVRPWMPGRPPQYFRIVTFLWPAIGLTRSLYLKELYVSTEARRAGIGKLLMQHLYDIAVKNNCSRVEWTTDDDNREAQLFYAELEVPVKESKLFYRIEGDELTRRSNP
jgi:GNAT superfamily N-acetyltransferase